jgi:hypothetical protein
LLGGPDTVIVTLEVATPPGPEHERVYVDVRRTKTPSDPSIPCGWLQAPDARHEVA